MEIIFIILILSLIILFAYLNYKLNKENTNLKVENAQIKTLYEHAENKTKEWEQIKDDLTKSAKIAATEGLKEISETLSSQHRKDTTKDKEDQRNFTKEIITNLQNNINESKVKTEQQNIINAKNFEKFNQALRQTTDLTLKTNNDLNIISRAMSSPQGMGIQAETILENTIKSFGLEKNRDYVIQESIHSNNGKLRPDAIIFLPNNNAIVIDSKSSKFVLELAKAEENKNKDYIKKAEKSFIKSMKEHLRSLSAKDYGNAVKKSFNTIKKDKIVESISFIMWLPDDGTIEKIRRIDSTFISTAARSNIYLCGPSGLWLAIGIANNSINLNNQLNNHKKIITETEGLIKNIGTLVSKAEKVGNRLNSAQKGWRDYLITLNGGVVKSAKKIEKMGVKGNKEIAPISEKRFLEINEDES